MKKKIATILVVVLIMTCIPISSSAASNITVTYNGQPIYFDVQPQMVNNRVMVPMRAIFERFGMSVNWMPKTREIFAIGASRTIGMTIGSYRMLKNGTSLYIDVPPMILNNRTLVPLRAVAESLDIDVQWNGDSRTVIMKDGFADINPSNVLKNLAKSKGKFYAKNGNSQEYYDYGGTIDNQYGWYSTINIVYYPETDETQIRLYMSDEDVTTLLVMYATDEKTMNWEFILASGRTGDSVEKSDAVRGFIKKDSFNAEGTNGLSSLKYSLKNTYVTKQHMNDLAVPTIAWTLANLNDILVHFNTNISIRDLGFTAFADKHGIY